MSTITTIQSTDAISASRSTINTNFANLNTDKAELSGATFTGDISVPDEAYGVGWNGSMEVPTKNAVYDKIETMGGGGATTFLGLTDTPSSYTGQALKIVQVNAGATGLEFVTASGGGDALTANPLSQFAATTSAEFAGVISDETGTGSVVFANSPTLTTPNLGTPSALTLTNATGLPMAGLVASTTQAIGVGSIELGHASDTTISRVSAGRIAVEGVNVPTISSTDTLTNKTLTSPTLTTPVLGTPTSGNLSNCTADGTSPVGFRNIPQVSQSANYTLTLADAGDHILHPSADTTARTFTIPANSSVAFPVGTAVTFINQNGAGVITIAITTDTLRLAGAGTTGSRTLAANGIATAIKVTTTEWLISGVGLT